MIRCGKSPRKVASNGQGSKVNTPLLLHFDVNKTVIQSDSIQMKGIEEGVREGIAELFWGNTRKEGDKLIWEWSRAKPSCSPPTDDVCHAGETLSNYAQYCKEVSKNKQEQKEAIRTFKLAEVGSPVRTEMEKLLALTMKRMQLPAEVRLSKDAEAAGIKGSAYNMFPTLFHLTASLQRGNREFAIIFRSFGTDHENIQTEWNAFCEMKHPVFSKLLDDIGPMNGSRPGVPDRRISALHTLYRDAQGPVLILGCMTNGPPDASWDSWARAKPKPKTDTRNGREYIEKVLKAKTMEGIPKIQKWMKDHLQMQATTAIKDDWAWWQFNGEVSNAGKLMTLIPGRNPTQQLFYDDNIDYDDARIVDCRDVNGQPMPHSKTLHKLCVKVNPVEALLDDDYFFRKLLHSQGDHLDVGASLMGLQKQLTDLEEEKNALVKSLNSMSSQLKSLTEENRRMKLARRIQVRDEGELQQLLSKHMDLASFDQNGFRSVSDLLTELEAGHCWLEVNEANQLVRVIDMLFLRISFKDNLLIESHEQDAMGRITTRNYLPGVRVTLDDNSVQSAVERWFESGLQPPTGAVDLRGLIETDSPPVAMSDAAPQQTGASQAYPLTCTVQQSLGHFSIPEKWVELDKEKLHRIGLPGGKHFTTTEKDLHGGTVTRFWRWDKQATFQATGAQAVKGGANMVSPQNVAQTCEKLFKDNPRSDTYKRLLLEMFETFEAQKLTGGFSGSVVIRVQPFEADGRKGEPCIVKMDAGDAIEEEYQNSKNVYEALPDRAARILGEAHYAHDAEGHRFGAMRLELAGACWNVPELAQGSANLLSTFKDLLLYESEQSFFGVASANNDVRPFGNVNSVLAETFGPGGVVSALRKGGPGKSNLRRSLDAPLLWGWYSLKGKEGQFNPLTAKKGEYPPTDAIKRIYKEHFNGDPPNLKELVTQTIKGKLESLAKTASTAKPGSKSPKPEPASKELFPLVGLAHGDLNAANIMIDALDAVWLIDFATSVDLPLFTDMCKFEMACLFEYAIIPITPKLLVEFASTKEEMWASLNVGDWLKVDQSVATELLRKLVALQQGDRLNNLTQEDLHKLIDEVVSKSGKAPLKQRALMRAMKARLCTDPALTDAAFQYACQMSNTLLTGDYLHESLEKRAMPLPSGKGALGAVSLRYFMDIIVSIRRFMLNDIMGVIREQSKTPDGLQPVDVLSLQVWLPFLRESFRILGYRDIAPQYKIWSMYHCKKVSEQIQHMLSVIESGMKTNLTATLLSDQVRKVLEARKGQSQAGPETKAKSESTGLVEMSRWILARSAMFPVVDTSNRITRKIHTECPLYCQQPGFFSPIWEVLQADGTPLTLEFATKDDLSKQTESVRSGPAARTGGESYWDIMIEDPMADESESTPQAQAARRVSVGHVALGKKREALSATLKSHLFYMGLKQLREKAWEPPKDVNRFPSDAFSLQNWSGHHPELDKILGTRHSTATVEAKQPFLAVFLQVDAVACDHTGREMAKLTLSIGIPVYCYPPGCSLCVDITAEGQGQVNSPSVVVVGLNSETGHYLIRSMVQGLGGEAEVEFDPAPSNHIFPTQVRYIEKQSLLVKKDAVDAGYEWVDAEVVEVADASTGYQYRLILKNKDARSPGGQDSKAVMRHLDCMNSGSVMPGMTAEVFGDEIHKIKAFFRARYSFVVDALSGTRLNVKECAPPTLSLKAMATSEGSGEPSRSASQMLPPAPPKLAGPRKASGLTAVVAQGSGSSSESGGAALNRVGWPTIISTLESFEKGQPTCQQNAFLVLGSPGSGKSCLVCRVIMETLDRYVNLVPLLIPVADLVKRSGQDTDTSNLSRAAIHDWFDKYLRVTYGEDSNRYFMICQAMHMKRVAFLFEGLEEAATLMKVVEAAIKQVILDGHLVIITSRPLLEGQSSLEEMSEHILAMKLENLSDEHKRAVARKRLGPEGMEIFDKLFKRLKESQAPAEAQEDVGEGEARVERDEGDVFGNPMMLSMLLCYVQTMQSKKEEAEKVAAAEGEERVEDLGGATLTAVYRVAIDVMLQRVQSKQQADRHNKGEKVQMWQQILYQMSLKMQCERRQEISAADVEALLKSEELKKEWQALNAAVVAGHAMFLRLSQDAGKTELKFLVKGFQNYFAAQAVADGNDRDLPALSELLTDPWWAQMLEMLAEARPHSYVQLVERGLRSFQPQGDNGETFLHIAARAGHRPVFQLLKLLSKQNQEALHKRSKDLRTPLHVAAERGNTGLCELMLESKAPLDAQDANECLAMHVAMQHGAFQTAKFLMSRWNDEYSGRDVQYRIKKKQDQAERLAKKLLQEGLGEQQFKEEAEKSFVELQYFSQKENVERARTTGALLAVYWITANHYELFVRGQGDNAKLQKKSWDSLQEWTQKTVGLKQKNAAAVGAMLVFVEIMNLGKIKPFRMAFAPDFDEPTEALHHILQKAPMVIPSFSNLEDEMQQTILSGLKADFNFGQFLQAENLPASLVTVKQILGDDKGANTSTNMLGFFLFKIFAAMCGILGSKSLEGSLFMTDKMYTNFKVGLDVLQHLNEKSAEQVYDAFLQKRSEAQGLVFSEYDPSARALVRLACLARAFDPAGGKEVSEAMASLPKEMQQRLRLYINADGITEKPGFLLYASPGFLENAKKNKEVGLGLALKVLLCVYDAAAEEFKGTDKPVVTIMMEELMEHAKMAGIDAESFAFTKFEMRRAPGYKSDSQGSVHISPWQLVTDQKKIDGYGEEGASLTHDVLRAGMREPGFLKRLQAAFPEMEFMTKFPEDDVSKNILRETLCALLVVYWTASDQVDAFSRGQQAEQKLSEKSWKKIQELMQKGGIVEEPVLNAVFVIMVIHALGKLPKLHKQLAPQAEGSRQVIAQVLDSCPKVLPSFCRLDAQYQALARECLTRDFSFGQFLSAELLPASITTVKELAMQTSKDEQNKGKKYLSVFLYCLFAEMSASMGPQSLDGSLYMTESRWEEFESGWEAMDHLERESEQDIYDRILQHRADKLGLPFDKTKPESRALVRLACLCRVADSSQGKRVSDAFSGLEQAERQALTTYLNADGLKQKPAFILSESTSFLENALDNKEVGLLPALRILLKVYNQAAKEFRDSNKAVLTVRLEHLAAFAKDFGSSVTFQDLSFDLVHRKGEAIVHPKMWIPVQSKTVLDDLAEKGRVLAKEILEGKVSERQFKNRIPRAFPELSYFNASTEVQRQQTYCAMLAVVWICSNQHEAFIRQQAEDEQLSKQSWAWIQGWIKEGVQLRSPEVVDAILTFMSIHALGKIKEFREELAPGFVGERHDLALEHILRTQPEVVPSFLRLGAKYQKLIIDSLSVDFQFSQFLQAENVPANLVVVKEKLMQHGDDGFAFFCFRIFVQMCGKLGSKTLAGSLFMTEHQFQRFRPGLDALQNLRTLDAGPAYNAFLLLQGSKALSRFASPEHQALARLLCLGSASDYAGGDSVCEAFDTLPPVERAQLTRWLTADGITSRPGYVLCAAPDLLRNAQMNSAVGLTAALRMLVRVQERCDVTNSKSLRQSTYKVYVHLNELAAWAQDASALTGDFDKARVDVSIEDLGDTRVFAVQVHRPNGDNRSPRSGAPSGGCCSVCCACLRCLAFVLHAMLVLGAVAAALAIYFMPDKAAPYVKLTGLRPRTALLACGGVGAALFLLLLLLCCKNRCREGCGGCCGGGGGCCGAACADRSSCRTCCTCRAGCGFPFSPRAGTLVCGYSRVESDII